MRFVPAFILLFVVAAFSQPMVTGYLNPSNSGSWSRMNTEQALNSGTTVHSCIDADSVAVRPGKKWGSNYLLKVIYNNSGSTQKYTIVDSTKETGLDTFHLNVAAYSNSFPLPYCVLISGAVVDSTLYVRQYIGR
jgi:hypothetical protein